MKELLVVVDMQNDFVTGSLANADAQKIVPRIAKKLKKTKKDVMFTMDTHDENYLETFEGKKLPVKHCIKGTEGWKIVSELGEYAVKSKAIVEKKSFGAVTLIQLIDEYDTIEFVGTCTDICVVNTILLLRSFFPDKELIVDKKCCAGTSRKAHNAAILVMQNSQIDIK